MRKPEVETLDSATISSQTFEKVRRLVYDKAGIDLRTGKEQLVSARLGKKLRQTGFRSYDEYVNHVMADSTGESLIALIDALSTNFTSFLRESAHFDFLKEKVLPGLANRSMVEIWCAAAATGEEPYSLMLTMLDYLGGLGADRCRMLATDISTNALAQAKKAIYPEERLASVPKEWLSKYTLRGEGNCKGLYQIKPEICRRIEFRRLNLIEPITHGKIFPVIFCRNVMIYFDRQTQERVVNQLTACLEPGGYLFVGHSEGLNGINHPLRFVRPAIYQRPDRGGHA